MEPAPTKEETVIQCDESQSKNTLYHRRACSSRMIAKYPDRVPTVVLRASETTPEIDQQKFMVPHEMTVGKFIQEIRKHVKLGSEQAIFIFVNNRLPNQSSPMSQLYHNHKNEDGFLYITYAIENTFGSM